MLQSYREKQGENTKNPEEKEEGVLGGSLRSPAAFTPFLTQALLSHKHLAFYQFQIFWSLWLHSFSWNVRQLMAHEKTPHWIFLLVPGTFTWMTLLESFPKARFDVISKENPRVGPWRGKVPSNQEGGRAQKCCGPANLASHNDWCPNPVQYLPVLGSPAFPHSSSPHLLPLPLSPGPYLSLITGFLCSRLTRSILSCHCQCFPLVSCLFNYWLSPLLGCPLMRAGALAVLLTKEICPLLMQSFQSLPPLPSCHSFYNVFCGLSWLYSCWFPPSHGHFARPWTGTDESWRPQFHGESDLLKCWLGGAIGWTNRRMEGESEGVSRPEEMVAITKLSNKTIPKLIGIRQ